MIIEDIERTKDDRAPDEQVTADADLTGHTAHLVIETAAGVPIDSIAASIISGPAQSVITFPISAAAVGTAGSFRYSVIVDLTDPGLRETKRTGDWTVVDRPG